MSLPPADEGYHWEIDPTTGEYFQFPNDTVNNPPDGSVPVGAPNVNPTNTAPDGTVTTTPNTGGGDGGGGGGGGGNSDWFEGRSFGPAQEAAWISEALGKGVPQGWIDSFMARNPHDANRIYEQWLDEQTANGAANRNGGSGGGGGGGGGGGTSPLNPPGPFVAPKYTAPVWNQPAAYVAPIFQEPDPWTYAKFEAPTLEQAKNEPGYAFAMEEGARALEQSASARGTLNTGGTLKDLIGYGQRLGELNYNNVFNRSEDLWSTNKDLSKSIWDQDYEAKKDKFDYDSAGGLEQYTQGYNASKASHEALVHSAEAEYKPIYDSAYQSYLTSYNVWQELFRAAQELEQDND